MPTSVTLSRHIDPALDPAQLYAQGVELTQRLSGQIWTDYNVHDPGVTLLEHLCYTLTDLNYRAAFSVSELLSSSVQAETHSTLFSARTILCNRALTELDYRKLLIDLKGIKNCWILPAEQTPALYADTLRGELSTKASDKPEVREVHPRGLYRVLLDFVDSLSAEEQAKAQEAAQALLLANRNLCEDFIGFERVGVDLFNLCCELELEPRADPAEVQARILFQVDRLLSPPVPNYTLEEMLKRTHPDGAPFRVDEIFDGPSLSCGFIDDDELLASNLREHIFLSDIISVVQDVPGVRAIRDIVFTPTGVSLDPASRWRVPVSPGRKALLNPEHSRMVFYKRSTPLMADPARVAALVAELVAGERQRLENPRGFDRSIPPGRVRDTGGYDSVQNHFPAIYGLSAESAPVGERRTNLAQQLKGYLLHFDQLMADSLALLHNIGRLYSADPSLRNVRFHQVVETLHGYEQVYASAGTVLAQLQSEDQQADPSYTLRNRLLDHVIARFAEDLVEQLELVRSVFGLGARDEIRRKCNFLQSLPALGSERGLAYNRGAAEPEQLWNTTNISGLERRLSHLLALDNPSRRNLSSVAYDLYNQLDSLPGSRYRFRVRHAETGKILLSSSTSYASPDIARAELQVAITLAKSESSYSRHQARDGSWYFNIVDPTQEVVARRIEYFDTEAAMELAIEQLIDYLRALYSEEGLYVIEAILLRPLDTQDPLLPICPDPNCVECFEADPYSYRVHIVLPAFGQRFQRREYRAFIEQTIRAELPAHLMPRICWISQEDMAELEGPYQTWVRALAGASIGSTRAEALARLRDALFKAKNVYPSAALVDCDAPESTERFILGETALGTGKNS